MIEIHCNGAPTRVPADETVAGMITALTGRSLDASGSAVDGRPLGMAVAVNAAVVPRIDWAARVLAPGDQVEVLTAAQGG